MKLVPPGPDRDRLTREARATMARQREAVLVGGPYVGVRDPRLSPAIVAEWEFGADRLRTLTLAYGSFARADGPFVCVRTSWAAAAGEPSLRRLLEDERQRAFEHAGVDEREPTEVATSIGQLPVADTWLAATARTEDHLSAARVEVPVSGRAVRVTVLARGVALSELALTLVRDVQPYWAARERWLARR